VSQDGIELPRRMGDFEPVDRQRDLPLDVDSENGMRELLHALPAAVYVTDAAGRIICPKAGRGSDRARGATLDCSE
jgi:hypothetical protein